ncbi:MAG: threo-3-hydroxy-L-aspartate ammonia-lyase [Saezia sp.]
MQNLPVYEDVVAAARRLKGQAHVTPVLRSSTMNREIHSQIYFKCENLQRMGAFKFRGAFNALAQLNAEQRKHGVLTYSSGNHAQAIALAGRLLGVTTTILMPTDAPLAKIDATKGYGGNVVMFDRYKEDREALGRQLADEKKLTIIPPYDHPHVIAGQGTAVKELIEEVGELDALIVPVGGGGLISGSSLSARALCPNIRIYGVEPEAGDDGRQSLRKGEVVHIETPKTIADGAQTQHLGKYTFEIIKRELTDILTASDDDLRACMRFFAERMKIYVEPTGCLGLAALQANKELFKGQRIGVVVSGGNIDLKRFASLIS